MSKAGTVKVTYEGPAGLYRAIHEGTDYPLHRGVSTSVPKALADHLISVPDHDFKCAASKRTKTVEDPAGVNDQSPYGEE